MKRVFFIILFMMVLMASFSMNDLAAIRGRLMVTGYANYLRPSDDGFRDIYGSRVSFFEVKAGFMLFRRVYLWGGYGAFSKEGKTPVLGLDAESKQRLYSGGLGYMQRLFPRINWKIEAGVLKVNYEEQSLGVVLSDSAVGFRVDTGVFFRLGHLFIAEITVGYLSASDTIGDVSIKLGGLKTGVGLGIRL